MPVATHKSIGTGHGFLKCHCKIKCTEKHSFVLKIMSLATLSFIQICHVINNFGNTKEIFIPVMLISCY
jgi:hypothetical protein